MPQSPPENKLSRFLWLQIAVALVLWASAFPAIRVALREYSPAHVALGRYLVASLTMAILLLGQRIALPQRADWWRILAAGFCGFTLYNLGLNSGEVVVPAGIASFLVNTAPIWTLIVLTISGRERISPRAWIGVFISLGGVALIALARGEVVGSAVSGGEETIGNGRFLQGALWILLAAFGTSFYVLLQKNLLQRISPLPLTAWAIWAGTFFLLPFGGGLWSEVASASAGATWSLVYMGVFPGAIAYVLWTRVLVQMDVSRAVSFIYLIPLIATAISWVWLGERLPLLALVGGFLTLGGVVWTNTAKKQHQVLDVSGSTEKN